MGKPTLGLWSASRQFDRGTDLPTAIDRYNRARSAALDADAPTLDQLDEWGASVEGVIVAPAANVADLATKLRVMLVEGRGGDSCLIALLEDADVMALADQRVSDRELTDERVGKAVSDA